MLSLLLSSILLVSHPFSLELTMQNVFDYIGKPHHVVVHFFTEGCRHCIVIAPHWNELVRMYRPVPNLSMATVNCNHSQSLCMALDGTSTPSVQYFAPRHRTGVAFGGEREIVPLTKWVRNKTGLDPYTKPNSILFGSPEEIADLTGAGRPMVVVVDNPRKQTINHTVLRRCEALRVEIPFRAISSEHFQSDVGRYCPNERKSCVVVTDGKQVVEYAGEMDEDELLTFIDIHAPSEL
jgi:thiol-disulfide isomerase/thioredoxin